MDTRPLMVSKWGMAVLSVLLLSSCVSSQLAPTPPAVYTQAAYTVEEYNVDRATYHKIWSQATHAASDSTLAQRTALRNKIVYATAKEIDKSYGAFKNAFFGERALAETTADLVQIGLGLAGTLAGGEAIKEILSAAATGVAGSRLSYNKNFFKEKAPDILLSRMDALRSEQWSRIYLQLAQATDETYSLAEAERDLVTYYRAGSLEEAVQNIIAESGVTQKKADAEIKSLIVQKYGETLSGLASAEELQEIKALFKEW